MKGFGVLCAVSSLPSRHGVGDFGSEAYKFVDALAEGGVDFWQVLPLAKTNDCNCPYGANSTHTIDEMYVDLCGLVDMGLLDEKEILCLEKYGKTKKVLYKPVKENKLRLFEKAFDRADESIIAKAQKFASQKEYVHDYAYYKTMLEVCGKDDWRDVDKKYWKMSSADGKKLVENNKKRYQKYIFFQYILFDQWKKLKKYANSKGIKILGDLPIYCEQTSLEVFRNPKYFKLDKNFRPLCTGGCPPDKFSETGQDWGTCVFNWKELKKEGYAYMVERVKNELDKFDYLRLDHFIGLVEHFENSKVPTVKSAWHKEGGDELFGALKEKINITKLFAEDIGQLSEECVRVCDKYNLKGMRILESAFDSDEKNVNLPQNVCENSIYYLGNHDNNTFIGFLQELDKNELQNVKKLLKSSAKTQKALCQAAIAALFASKADVVILQIQDVLLQDGSARMNVPGKSEGCWEYKLPHKYISAFQKNLKNIAKLK